MSEAHAEYLRGRESYEDALRRARDAMVEERGRLTTVIDYLTQLLNSENADTQ